MSGYIFGKTDYSNAPVFIISAEGGSSILVPAGTYVNSLSLKPTVDEQINISDIDVNGTDIEELMPAAAGISSSVAIEKKYDVDTLLYFSNITGNKIEITVYTL